MAPLVGVRTQRRPSSQHAHICAELKPEYDFLGFEKLMHPDSLAEQMEL